MYSRIARSYKNFDVATALAQTLVPLKVYVKLDLTKGIKFIRNVTGARYREVVQHYFKRISLELSG